MITISGLTDRQKTLMDLLWGCQDIEQIRTLIAALPSAKDKWDAMGLVEIATVESIEQELGFDKECIDAATAAINAARLR